MVNQIPLQYPIILISTHQMVDLQHKQTLIAQFCPFTAWKAVTRVVILHPRQARFYA